MSRQDHSERDSSRIPHPLVARGDYVRLESPYPGASINIRPAQRAMLKRHLFHQYEILQEHYERPDDLTIESVHRSYENIPSPFTFTHGTVAEIVTRCSATRITRPLPDIPHPPKTVSLHLYNPRYGICYMGAHPTEPGKPEFVDTHVGDLTVIQKATEAWNSRELHVADLYESEYGITLPQKKSL